MNYKTFTAAALVLLVSAAGFAAAPADAPAGSTGLCKDGSFYTGAEKQGACTGHKGVKEWYGEAPASKAETKGAPAATPSMAAAPAKAAASASSMSKTSAAPSVAPAAGGGGQVWVNTASKVYHCQGTKYYGKTKKGEYVTEAAAKTAGNHASHGKACT